MIVHIWRHPKPIAAKGLCFGQTDLAVDRRKLKRLANRIDRLAKNNNLPKVIWVSPLLRSRLVGELLAQRGFECHIAPELVESNFGVWEGRPWSDISKAEVDEWCEDFANFAPSEGENLSQLFERVAAWIESQKKTNIDKAIHQSTHQSAVLAVGHAGWITTAKMICDGEGMPQLAQDWPRPVNYCELSVLNFNDNLGD